MKLLEMKQIRKAFAGMEVIKDISLSVSEGEIVAIIGPSGSGKSTLLRCATMLETIDGGEICYLGKAATWVENGRTMFPKKEERREIQSYYGLVFQNFNLFPHYSVIKNIASKNSATGRYSGFRASFDYEIVDELFLLIGTCVLFILYFYRNLATSHHFIITYIHNLDGLKP